MVGAVEGARVVPDFESFQLQFKNEMTIVGGESSKLRKVSSLIFIEHPFRMNVVLMAILCIQAHEMCLFRFLLVRILWLSG